MQRKGFGEDSRGARNVKWNQQRFNAGGCDGIGPLSILYPQNGLPVGPSRHFDLHPADEGAGANVVTYRFLDNTQSQNARLPLRAEGKWRYGNKGLSGC